MPQEEVIVSYGTFRNGRCEGIALVVKRKRNRALVMVETRYKKGDSPVVISTYGREEFVLSAFALRVGELQRLPYYWYAEDASTIQNIFS